MIPVTFHIPDQPPVTIEIHSWQALKAINELADAPGKVDGYSISYEKDGTDHIISPVCPNAISYILSVYIEGGFV